MREISVEFFTFQHGTPTTRDSLPSFRQIYGPISPLLNPVDYKIWGKMQQRLYEYCVHS